MAAYSYLNTDQDTSVRDWTHPTLECLTINRGLGVGVGCQISSNIDKWKEVQMTLRRGVLKMFRPKRLHLSSNKISVIDLHVKEK